MNRRIQLLAFTIVLEFSLPVAYAEETEAAKQEAQKLYQDAATDIDQRAYGRACPKLEAARKLLPDHVRTSMSLAECYDKLERPATALEVFESAKSLALAQGKADKVSEIDSKMAALRSRVPRLTFSVPQTIASLPGLAIARNDVSVLESQWGTPVPVNPGRYQIEVTATDKAPWKTSVEIQMGKNLTVEIEPPWNVPDGNPNDGGPISDSVASRGSALRIAGFVGIGLGVVGVGAGAVLGGLAVSKNNASDDGHCKPNNFCDQIGFNLRNDARTLGNASTASLIVGSVLAAGGVVLIVMTGKSKEASGNAPQASVWLGPSSVGVHGRW